jgi:CspA family cold shock protein
VRSYFLQETPLDVVEMLFLSFTTVAFFTNPEAHAWTQPELVMENRYSGVGQRRRETMASGKVKWFDNKKGFGFIAQETGQDVFVHHTSIIGGGFKTLNEGEEVTFEVITSDKGLKAQNVQRAQA